MNKLSPYVLVLILIFSSFDILYAKDKPNPYITYPLLGTATGVFFVFIWNAMNPPAKHFNYWAGAGIGAGAGLVFAIIEDTKEKRTYQIIMTPNVSIEANNDKLRMNNMKYGLTMTLSM